MSCDPEAKLFYGYIQPPQDEEERDEDEYGDTPWDRMYGKKAYRCIGDMYGYDEHIGHFLAVEDSLHKAEWDQHTPINQSDIFEQPEWSKWLAHAVNHFGLDVEGRQPGWYLVSLYF